MSASSVLGRIAGVQLHVFCLATVTQADLLPLHPHNSINKAILDRLTTLEARVDDLEAAGASDGIASPDPSDLQTGTTGENYGRSTTTPRALLPSGPVTPAEGPNHVSNKLDTMSLKPVLPPLIQKSSMDGITLPGMSALSQKKVANNDATEEAALALESLCRPNLTGQVNAQSVPVSLPCL